MVLEEIHELQKQSVKRDSEEIWKAMTNRIDKRIKLPHDGYLKLFQLENPDLQLNFEHDVLMIDEG